MLPPRGSGIKTDDEAALARAMQGQIEGYLIAMQGATAYALKTTIRRITRGEIDGISRRYCPMAPELSAAIREEMADVVKKIDLEKNRSVIEDNRPNAVKRPNILEKVNAQRARMTSEGRALLIRFDSFDAFIQYSRRNVLPKGFFYIPATAELYGASGSAYEEMETVEKEVSFVSDEFLKDHYDTSAEASLARLEALAEENGKEFHLDRVPNSPNASTFKQVARAA